MRPSKPAYSVPTMAEIAAIPLNGYKAVSTFSGCGGSSLGYRMAGFKMLWANEFVKEAQEVYRANFPDTLLDTRDIRKVQASDILAATGLERGELDLLDGSPPCSSFSTAGKRAKGWGKAHNYSTGRVQRTDDLFFEFVRLLDGLQPRVFVAENVSGLVKGVGKGYFLEILTALRSCGYRVRSRLLDAQWLGVPQARQRLIFIGTRDDLDIDPAFPAPLAYRYSVRDALPWIGAARVVHDTSGLYGAGDVTGRPCPTVTVGVNSVNSHHFQVTHIECANGFNGHAMLPASGPAPTITVRPVKVMTRNGARSTGKPAPTVLTHGRRHTTSELTLAVEPESDMRRFAVGRELDKLGQGEQSGRYFQLTRAALAEPSGTITAAGGNASTAAVAHPTECRKFSIAELRRICAFPDDFVLTGTYAQQWERLGRAVPPVMMRAIAETIRDRVLAAAPSAREKGADRSAPLGRAA
jgi:DNA (cytosine-5)-methyltransferase 1